MIKKQRERKRELDEGGESETMAENEAEIESLFPAVCEIHGMQQLFSLYIGY